MLLLYALLVVLLLTVLYDVTQKKHAILRNFPVIGHFRYWLETIGPELRQYIVTGNDEERPFTRDERRWVYASSKKENNYFGFGTDGEVELASNYLIVKHDAFGPDEARDFESLAKEDWPIPCAKVLGRARGRKKQFRPRSIVNISGMSFGSLSAAAVEALNRGAKLAGCLHNTGEGGISPYHRNGGELVWQLGTAYFGARSPDGGFDLPRFIDQVASAPVKAVEIKLSQGAKPGLGGLLPGAKVTPEIAGIRGVPVGKDVHSPSRHTEFGTTNEMLDFVEMLASETGLPVGIKSAVGSDLLWTELAELMESGTRGVDFITVDGGEGGTGAAPLVFSDHVAFPFKVAMSRVFRAFAERGVDQNVVFFGSGKLGFPERAVLAMALGCDGIMVAREPMLSIGCIQAQRCHTGHCPTGVATQNRWLMRGLDPTNKSARLANYVVGLRKEITWLTQACGVRHPALITGQHLEILDGRYGSTPVDELFGYETGWGVPSERDLNDLFGG